MEAATTTAPICTIGVGTEGHLVDVFFDPASGKFSAEFAGEEFSTDTLSTLRSYLKDAFIASRVEVPFVDGFGRRGVMRGFHAGHHSILVTWANGQKDKISTHDKVWRAENVTDETINEIQNLITENGRIADRLKELGEGRESADGILNEAVGEEVTAYGRHR